MGSWRNELYHYGILGMKWGVRRYQNHDGSYTAAGRSRYGLKPETKEKVKKGAKVAAGVGVAAAGVAGAAAYAKGHPRANKEYVPNIGKGRDLDTSMFDRTIKRGKDKENTSPAEATMTEAQKSADALGNIARKHQEIQRKKEGNSEFTKFDRDISKKSDQQLKHEIDRMQSELRWDDLDSQVVNRGRVAASDYLEQVKNVMVVAGSAATIAALIVKKKAGA